MEFVSIGFGQWAVTALSGLVMFFGKKMIDDNSRLIERLKTDLQSVRDNYVHRDDFKDFKNEIRDMFSEIRTDIKEIKNAQ